MSDSPAAAVSHGDNPALLHHFADEQQQHDAADLGMWIFLATEVMFFGGLFCAYLIYRRWYYEDFAAASSSIDAACPTPSSAARATLSDRLQAMGVNPNARARWATSRPARIRNSIPRST